RPGQLGQGGGAHVRAEGEAQEHQGPVSGQLARQQRGAVGLAQVERRQLARLRQQGHRLQGGTGGRGVAVEEVARGQQAQAGGERDGEDVAEGAVEHGVSVRGAWRRAGHDSRCRGKGGRCPIIHGPFQPARPARTSPMTDADVASELHTIIDLIRYGGSRFNEAGLTFGHSYDNAMDEATQLVLHALHLPHDLSPVYGQSRLTSAEKAKILELFRRRIEERIPAAYLVGEAWFAGLSFKSDARALVPRSPIAELIENGFEPWLGGREVHRALD